MGRLVGLELYNFKSYKGKASIGFGDAFFTSIIGPNGSGKSNMMDAISFVLGVQSSHLRSQNLKDLIYRGRRTEDGVPSKQDPTRAHVMIKYEKENGEILDLMRTVNNSGASEYKINKKTVTALYYTGVLKAENILIKARNFLVFQGDVEQIASQTPKQLTSMIETISGSGQYIEDYNKLKEELEQAHERTISVFSRKRVLNSESKQYKEQLVEQREFEDLVSLKLNTIKKINLYKIYHNDQKHNDLSKSLKLAKERLIEYEHNLKEINSLHADSVAEFSKMPLEKKKKQQIISTLASESEHVRRELIPIEANKKALSAKIGSAKRRLDQLKQETVQQEKLVQSTANELSQTIKMFQEAQQHNLDSSSPLSFEGSQEYDKLQDEYMASGGSQLEAELALLENERDFVQTSIDSMKTQIRLGKERIINLESQVESEYSLQLSELESDIGNNLDLQKAKIAERNAFLRAKEECKFKEADLNLKLRDTFLVLEDISSKQRESNKQIRIRETISLLKQLVLEKSIKGLVCELVRPTQQKYETALSTVLGKNSDSIIVDTTSTALKCIEILKERRMGVATFIPLDAISHEQLNLNYLRSISEQSRPAIDILEYDESSLEQAIQYVAGGSLVVDTVESARKLKWGSRYSVDCKIVTLDGSIIHKSGLMTGGQKQEKPSAAVAWDRKEYVRITEIKEGLMDEISKLQSIKPKELEINLISSEVEELESKIPHLREAQANLRRIIDDRNREIEFQREAVSKLEICLESKKDSYKRVDESIAEVFNRISSFKESMFESFCNKYGLSGGIVEYETSHGNTLRARAKEKARYTKGTSYLKNKLKFEEDKLLDLKNRDLTSLICRYEEELISLSNTRDDLVHKMDSKAANLDLSKDELALYEIIIEKKAKELKGSEMKKTEIESMLAEINKQVISFEEALFRVDIAKVNLLKDCKIQNVELPLKDGFLDTLSLGEDADQSVRELSTIEVDYSLLDSSLTDHYNPRTEADLLTQVQAIDSKIEKLAPNARATDRLKEVEDRLREFEREHMKVRHAQRRVSKDFEEVKQMRIDLFMGAFTHISSRIDSIYKELTVGTATPLGGSAYLTLEDEEAPFEGGTKYHAMPPMKRFRDMDMLSGGEKTMAALALLFAIHSFQPSPFFVLDEVDAALDNANVSKIAAYIKKNAELNYQFIVISLKNSLFEKSDALVGIYKEQVENSSKTVTLDLRDYPDEEIQLREGIASN